MDAEQWGLGSPGLCRLLPGILGGQDLAASGPSRPEESTGALELAPAWLEICWQTRHLEHGAGSLGPTPGPPTFNSMTWGSSFDLCELGSCL